MLARASALAGRELTAGCWQMPEYILNGPVVPAWPRMVSRSGRALARAAVRAGWLPAWLRPLIVRERPSTVNGAAHLFPPAKSAAEKDGPAGRH